MAIEPQVVHLTADENGDWSSEFVNDFKEGVHAVVVINDDTGHEEFSLFEIVAGPAYLKIILSLLALFLLILIIFFSLKNVRLVKKLKRKKPTTFFSYSVISISFVLIFILGYLNIDTFKSLNDISSGSIINEKGDKFIQHDLLRIGNVAGQVIDPLNGKSVSGVNVRAEEVFIETSDSGQFVFMDIDLEEGIHVTHPLLIRSLRQKIDVDADVKMFKFYFNVDMYNTLISIVNLESRGQIGTIYDEYLNESDKMIRDKNDFILSYNRIFTNRDSSVQELVLGSFTVLDDDSFELEIFSDAESSEYILIFDNDKWSLKDDDTLK